MPVLHLYPHDAEERLGFDRIRVALRRYARTLYGLEHIERIGPSSRKEEVEARLARVGEMQEVLRSDSAVPFSSLEDVRPVLEQIAPEGAYADGRDLADIANVLAVQRKVRGFFEKRKDACPALWAVAQLIEQLAAVEEVINAIVAPNGEVREDASPELQRISQSLASRQSSLRKTLMNALRNAISEGYATEEQPTIRGGRSVIPVRAEARRKVSGFVHDVSSTGQTVYIEPAEVLDLNNEIRELEAERKREIERLLREATKPVREHRVSIESGLQVIGHIDANHSAAKLANALDAHVPQLNDDGLIRLVRAKNAVLALHFKEEGEGREVVPLSLELGDAAHTLIITGPNAGGKSVAMKTVGLLSLMVQSGLPIPAAPGTTLPVFTSIFVDLGDRQSIQEDLSTFTSHLTAINKMVAEADEHSLVLIDEAGTGTDPAEGGALAQAVFERLTELGARTVATTHHGNLKAFAHATAGVVNGSMQFDRESLSPSYMFLPDIPGSSYAFEIADRVGLDGKLVDRARDLVGEGKVALEDLIASFETTTQQAERERDEAQRALNEAEKARDKYESQLDKLRSERDKLRAEALEDASQIVKDANAAVERTIREIKEADAEKEATKAARKVLDETRESIKRESHRAQRRAKKPSTQQSPTGPIQIGDQVRLDDGSTTGEVLELDRKEAVVAFGSMTTRAKLNRLQKVGGRVEQKVEVRARPTSRKTHVVSTISTRLDVRGQRVDEVYSSVTRFVDESMAAGLESVEILHGKGTGALRAAIRELLQARPDVSSVESAHINEGGDGVTVVQLA